MKGMLRGAVREDMQARLRMGLIHRNYPGRKSWKGNLWKNVSAFDVGEFLRKYTYPAGIHRFDPKLISQYIGRMVKDHEELTNWIVVLLGRNGGENIMRWAVGDGISINCNQRTGSERDAECVIRSVLSPEDEYIDLSREEWNDALELSLDFFRNGMLDQCRPPKYPV